MKVRRVVVNVYQDGKQGGEYSYTFAYPQANISFKVSQTDSESPDNCFIKIDGVSKDTYLIFDTQKNKKYSGTQRVEVYYGYNEELSLVFSGTIDRVSYQFNGGSQTLMMLVTKNTRKFHQHKRTVSMTGTQTIKSAVSILCDEYGYTPRFGNGDFGSIGIGRYCGTGTLKDALREVLPVDYGFYVNENTVHVYHKDDSVANEITIWPQNGLLAYPTEDSKGESTTIKTILLTAIESGMKINIPVDNKWFSATDTGTYKTYTVKNYTSAFGNGVGTTEFECEGGLDL